jgi:hypothetical protein
MAWPMSKAAGCALGALLSSLMTVSDLGDLSIGTYGDLLREAITDLLEPRGAVSPKFPLISL